MLKTLLVFKRKIKHFCFLVCCTAKENVRSTRSGGNSRLLQSGSSNMCSKTFINDAVRIWNQAPVFIKDAKSIYSAKKAIKEFVLTLPI